MKKTSLVLEGGGIRGIYTAGVLDYLMEKDFTVDCVIGVSAGALHAINYISGQKQRSLRIATQYLKDKRYLSVHSLLHTGDIFGAEFCYHTIPEQLDRYDYDAFRNSTTSFYATISNVETGKAEYKLCKDVAKDVDYIRASASLPLLSRIVETKEGRYLDGGICDSIPLKHSQKMGNQKNIVVLTRVQGYVKQPNKLIPVIKHKYRKYPDFVAAVSNRHQVYNETIQYMNEEEKKGNCFVIRPSKFIDVSRLEKNPEKIHRMYQLGYEDAKKQYEKLIEYIEK